MKLTAENVHKLFMGCLFKDEEVAGRDREDVLKEAIPVQGITTNIGFHRERLLAEKLKVKELLLQLPVEFFSDTGGGMSFLNACVDRNGDQWAEHSTMQELFLMGMGLDMVEFCLLRELWGALPGSMPYLHVKMNHDEKVAA